MRLTKYIFIGFFIWNFTIVSAQEVLTGLSRNPVLKNADLINKSVSEQKGSSTEILLPMIDDFSSPSFYPKDKYWASKSVFVNRSYAVNPPSIGVITFDAMNDTGAVYSHMGSFSSGADTLTTHNIRMDSTFGTPSQALTPADSVYLSFFVQPQGMGAAPRDGDSLVLQFYNSSLQKWKSVWNINGMSLDSFRVKYDTSFLQVLIPITDTGYFSSEFKFRFYNFASIPSADKPSWRSGLHSHWNLDYVVLDKNRNYADTSYHDMTIQTYLTSFLNDYSVMPWNQYQANPSGSMKYGLGLKYKNLDKIIGDKNVARYFYIYDLFTKTLSYEQTPTNPTSLNVGSQQRMSFDPSYTSYTFNSTAPQYPEFLVLYRIFTNSPPPDIILANDTMSFYQNFYNYLAYDDGVPEAGYGLSTVGGKLAYQFKLNVADTLQSVQFYFNQTLGNANQQYFNLTIWNDNNGVPGNIIYTKSGKRPEFENALFKYHTYVLDAPLAVSGTFYVGWTQTTKDNLNVGFDFNNNQSDKIFYNVTGSWANSGYEGNLMIRPILGRDENAYVGIKNIETNDASAYNLRIFPNPNEGHILNLSLNGTSNTRQAIIRIINLQGQIVRQQAFANKLDVSQLQQGIYFISVQDVTQDINLIQKLIITR